MQEIVFPDSRFVAQREYYGSDMALFLAIHISVWSSLGFPSELGLECWVTWLPAIAIYCKTNPRYCMLREFRWLELQSYRLAL